MAARVGDTIEASLAAPQLDSPAPVQQVRTPRRDTAVFWQGGYTRTAITYTANLHV